MASLEALEQHIGIHFHNEALLQEALTHRSYLNERPNWKLPHNERLEYLGDAVLELAVSEELFRRFPQYPEGQLTVVRAALVNYQMLARIATDLSLGEFLLLSRGERRDTGKAREVILANTIEALIGAVYLDQGFEQARQFIQRFVLTHVDDIVRTKSYKDPKSELQEFTQEELKVTPTYRVLEESGPAHERTFRVGVYLGDRLAGEGIGSSKQEGELRAAEHALRAIAPKKKK
jgi:ribonuclease-3